MSPTPLLCDRCLDPLEGSYRTQTVSAVHQLQSVAPDGGSTVIVAGAFVACSWNCLAILAAQHAGKTGDAVVRMVAERERQITTEGFSPEHDASIPPGELAQAGVCYVEHAAKLGEIPDRADGCPHAWPWDPEWWKPKSPDRDLIRAGALIAAEADRDPNPRVVQSPEPF